MCYRRAFRRGGRLSFFAELQRRRVFRVFVGYGVVAFGVLQAIEPIMHALHLPDVVLTYVEVGLGLGFPVAVVLAWAFDLNPKPAERFRFATSGTHSTSVSRHVVIIGAAARPNALAGLPRRVRGRVSAGPPGWTGPVDVTGLRGARRVVRSHARRPD